MIRFALLCVALLCSALLGAGRMLPRGALVTIYPRTRVPHVIPGRPCQSGSVTSVAPRTWVHSLNFGEHKMEEYIRGLSSSTGMVLTNNGETQYLVGGHGQPRLQQARCRD